MEWIASAISAAALIIVAVIEGRANRERKQLKDDRERTERRAEVRAQESRLSMELMSASCALSMVVAKKVTGQHLNGDVEDAMDSASAALKEYSDFVRKLAAKQVCKT